MFNSYTKIHKSHKQLQELTVFLELHVGNSRHYYYGRNEYHHKSKDCKHTFILHWMVTMDSFIIGSWKEMNI